MTINLGYACINMALQKQKICSNRGMIKRTFQSKGIAYASELALINVKALKKIIKYFPEDLTEMVSPFFGGGAIEIHYAQKHKTRVHGYDLFPQLVNFWEMVLIDPERLTEEVAILKSTKPDLTEIWTQAQDNLRNTEVTQDNAFGKDPQFFSFYRAMQSYEKALIGGDTSLILSPDSDFFKFFGKAGLIKKAN